MKSSIELKDKLYKICNLHQRLCRRITYLQREDNPHIDLLGPPVHAQEIKCLNIYQCSIWPCRWKVVQIWPQTTLWCRGDRLSSRENGCQVFTYKYQVRNTKASLTEQHHCINQDLPGMPICMQPKFTKCSNTLNISVPLQMPSTPDE